MVFHPLNQYLNLIISDKDRLVLGGFKYSEVLEYLRINHGNLEPSDTEYRVLSRPFDFGTNEIGTNYSFNEDCYSSICVVYCFFIREWTPTLRYPIKLHWPEEPYADHRRVLLKHLIKVLLYNCEPNHTLYNSFPISDALHHPYFMSYVEMSVFDARMRSFNASRLNRTVDNTLEAGRELVFDGDWLDSIHDESVKIVIRKDRKKQHTGFMGLLVFINNHVRHFYTVAQKFQDTTGPLTDSYYEYWLKSFPHYFLYLFVVCANHRPQINSEPWCTKKELRQIFPASKAFYEVCGRCTIVEGLGFPGDIYDSNGNGVLLPQND